MAPRIPVFSYRKMAKLLQQEGFVLVGQEGSHVFFRHEDGRTTVVPRHGRDIGRGLALKILHDAGLDPGWFRK